MKDEITIEDIKLAREFLDSKDVPANLGFICPYCNGHLKKGEIFNPKHHTAHCPIMHGEHFL